MRPSSDDLLNSFKLMFPTELSTCPLFLAEHLQMVTFRATADLQHALWEVLTHTKQLNLGTIWLLPSLYPFFFCSRLFQHREKRERAEQERLEEDQSV